MIHRIIAFLFIYFTIGLINAQTSGVCTITTTTSQAGGIYAPRNIVAIWIEDGAGNYVKTLLAYAQTYITHLNIWEAATTAAGSKFNIVDAKTGATRTNHGTHTCVWNGKNFNGILVADGTYKVFMELTDKNATGNYSSFPFTKGVGPVLLTPTNQPSFSSISINWVPGTAFISDTNLKENYTLFPNPTSGSFTINGCNIKEVEVRDVAGRLVYKSNLTYIDISNQPKGIYLIKVTTDNITMCRKIIKL